MTIYVYEGEKGGHYLKILKLRQKPRILRGLQYLDKRLELDHDNKRMLSNLEKGLLGESLFDEYISHFIYSEVLVLNDLLLVNKGTTFQIDSLMITLDTIYVFEIKNYSSSFVMSDGEFQSISGQTYQNPLIQLAKVKRNLESILSEWGIHIPIEANIIFINSTFFLYEAKLEDPMIQPGQIELFLTSINKKARNLEKRHHYLARKLVEAHNTGAIIQKALPNYHYTHFKKGLTCLNCGSFNLELTQRSCYCNSCLNKNLLKEVILDHIYEYQFLFPEHKLTITNIKDWCGSDVSLNSIRTVLNQHFKLIGFSRDAHYE